MAVCEYSRTVFRANMLEINSMFFADLLRGEMMRLRDEKKR
jgi:hypothetical protein